MKKNNYNFLLFFILIQVNCWSVSAFNSATTSNNSYFFKVKRDLTVFKDYLSEKMSSTLNIDLGVERMFARFKADTRKQYPSQQNFDGLKIRQGIDLCQSELAFVHNRMPKVTQALKQYFDVDAPLKIALCASGGGNRAMLVTLGFYLGAQDIGLFDSALYSAGVSGSTWTIIPWSYLNATQGMSLIEFKDQLSPRLNKTMATANGVSIPPMIEKYQKDVIINNIAKHYAYDQFTSSIDIYSGFIGNYALFSAGENRLDVTWSSIADTIKQGDMPLPMGAAVSYKAREAKKALAEYYWYEIGPFEVGSDQVGAYVPTKAFGSKFEGGKPVAGYAGQAPEYPLSFYMGVCGSVFAFSMHEIMDRITKRPSFKLFGQEIILPIDVWIRSSLFEFAQDARFSPSTFHNYAYGLFDSPNFAIETIRLYDGAMNFNFPLPLLMRPARQVDIIVICDAGVDITSLKLASLHNQRNGLAFPDITNYTEEMIGSKPLTVLNDPRTKEYNAHVATILYCPFIKNNGYSADFDPAICVVDGFCNTFNFKYNKNQAEQVMDLTRYNMNSIKDEIKEVLQALQKQKMS